MNNSLQQRLSLWLSASILVTGMVVSGISFVLDYVNAKEFQDHMLRQIALLAAQNELGSTIAEVQRPIDGRKITSESISHISVIRLPEETRPDWLVGNLKYGFFTLENNGEQMRVFVLKETAEKMVVVAQQASARNEMALRSALPSLVPLLLLIPFMVCLIVRIVRSELEPVRLLAAYLDAQPADHPHLLSEEKIPDEIISFVQAINRLLKRVNELMDHQRRFIADAAHELRSPLTALSVQVQNLKHSTSLEDMRERTQPLQAGIERARKLTEQLLNLARTHSEILEANDIDVSTMVRELIAEHLPLSEAKGIDLGLDLEDTAPRTLFTAAETLRLVLRNALENALKYTPKGGEVTLRIYADESSYFIEVVDNGPGIPVSERERVFDAFYRLPESVGEGSGLGLSIAREAALRLGGNVCLVDREQGAGLIFRFQQKINTAGLKVS